MKQQKIAIIGRSVDEPQVDQPSLYCNYLNKISDKIEYVDIEFDDLFFNLSTKDTKIFVNQSNTDLLLFNAVMGIGWFNRMRPYEDTVHALACYLKYHGKPFLNSEMLHRSKGKLSQYLIFSLHGLPIPTTIFHHDVKVVANLAVKKFGFPFIFKTTNGSRGGNNFLVRNDAELAEAITRAKDSGRVFCAQEYIENDGDYRILVMNGKVRYIIHRQSSSDSHLNNTSAGGRATAIKPDSFDAETISIALQAANLLGREVGGVDIMFSKYDKKPYILEVNNMPQLATGSYVDQKMQALNDMFEEMI